MSELLSNDAPTQIKSEDDVLDLFKSDDKPEVNEKPEDENEEVEDKTPKPKTEDKPEDEEIKLKEEDEDEEKLDLKEDKPDDDVIEIDAPPRKKDVVTKYPNFFKEFPFFEKLMYRDKQYTELFGSFDDAREVAERARILDSFEQDILNGSTERVLQSVKEVDKKAYDKLVDNYLPTLAKVDKEAYLEIVGNIGKTIIQSMAREAHAVAGSNKEQGELLNQAALLLNQFLFGTSTYTPPSKRVQDEKEDKNSELEAERRSFALQRFTAARDDLQTRVDNVLRSTISEYIDPKSEMPAYVRKNAIRDALTELHTTIGRDTAFRRNLDRLWEAAFQDQFSQNSLNRIRSTYLGVSKRLLGSIIKKVRTEALKDMVPSRRREENEDEIEETTPRRRGPISAGRPHHQSGKLKMEKGESVMDFFSRD